MKVSKKVDFKQLKLQPGAPRCNYYHTWRSWSIQHLLNYGCISWH